MVDSVRTVEKRSGRSRWRQIHYLSGLVVTAFVTIHLTNHLMAVISPATHIAVMTALRKVYRHPFVETILLATVGLQIITGLRLVRLFLGRPLDSWRRLQIGSGLYLALFLVIHVSAVLVGRFLLMLDTNLYFGAAGLNRYPYQLFFVPYYTLAVVAFFAHLAALHRQRMSRPVATMTPQGQAQLILALGVVVAFGVLYGMTGRFRGLHIPAHYFVLTP